MSGNGNRPGKGAAHSVGEFPENATEAAPPPDRTQGHSRPGAARVITDVTDVTGESRSSVATNGAGPIPTILHRCDYCGGQFGDMNSWNWPPDRPIRQILLHHHCEQPWWDCGGQPEGVR